MRSQAKRLTIAALPTDLLVTGTLRDAAVQPEIVELGIRGGIAAALDFASTPLAICRRSNSASWTIRAATIRCGALRAGGVAGRARASLWQYAGHAASLRRVCTKN